MSLVEPVIFLSSTRLDLQEYRNQAIKIIENHRLTHHSQENFVDDGERSDAVRFSENKMEQKGCNWYLGIIAFRQGHVIEGENFSVTEAEYRHALKLKDKGTYDRVFVMVASTIKDFGGCGDIFDNSDDLPDPDEDDGNFKQFQGFRKELDTNVNTIFCSFDEFSTKLNGILDEHWETLRISHMGELLKKYSNLFDLARQIHTVSEATRSALEDVQKFKDLHDLIHKFRQEVMVPVDSSLTNLSATSHWELTEKSNFLDYHTQLYTVIRDVSVFEKTEGDDAFPSLQRDLNSLKSHDSLFADVINSNTALLNDEFRDDFSELSDAIEALFDEFNKGLKAKADELKEPAEEVVKSLRNPVATGKISIENTSDRDAWLEELDRIDESSKDLIYGVSGHDQWQKWHYSLLEVDSLRRQLEYFSEKKTSDTGQIFITCDFLKELSDKLYQPEKDSNQWFLTEMLSRRSFVKDNDNDSEQCPIPGTQLVDHWDIKKLQKVYQVLLAGYEACPYVSNDPEKISDIDMTAGSPLARVIELYREFRNVFDVVFYKVDLDLKSRCKQSSSRVEKLLNLLTELEKTSTHQNEYI